MWVRVAVWQPCELLYTCYLRTYLHLPDGNCKTRWVLMPPCRVCRNVISRHFTRVWSRTWSWWNRASTCCRKTCGRTCFGSGGRRKTPSRPRRWWDECVDYCSVFVADYMCLGQFRLISTVYSQHFQINLWQLCWHFLRFSFFRNVLPPGWIHLHSVFTLHPVVQPATKCKQT